MPLTYTSLGDAGVMGTSCHHLTLNGTRVVIDAGRHPRTGDAPDLTRLRTLGADAIALTHAHLDHCGALPMAMRCLPGRRVLATPATAALATLVLKHHLKREAGAAGAAGLPFHADELKALQWERAAFGQTRAVGRDGVTARLCDAGHLLGSASVLLEGGGVRVFATGDLHLRDRAWQRGATLPDAPVDVLVCESTQGANDALDDVLPERVEAALMQAVGDALRAGGRVLLPVFALGRAQEVLAMLARARDRGEVPDAPVYLGGLAATVTRLSGEFMDSMALVEPVVDVSRFGTRPLTPAVARRPPPGPAVFLAGSGMVVEGSLAHTLAEHLLDDPAAMLGFVGYLDPDTPGFALRAGQRQARCALRHFPLTAHARRCDLVEVAARLQPRDIILVHGDEAARAGLAAALGQALPASRVHRPGPRDVLTV